MVWFITSSILSILVGLVIVTLEHPGAGLNLAIPKESVDTGLAVSGMSLKVPVSHHPDQYYRGDGEQRNSANRGVLDVLRYRRGLAGEKFNAPLVAALNVVSHIMLKVTGYVMYVAPLAIFAAISSVIASQGMGILLNYASFIGGYYIAVLLTSAVLLAVGYMVLKKRSSACSTCSKIRCWWRSPPAALSGVSEDPGAAGQFGCSRNIVSFVLPIGYSFNLVGSMVYCSFASMFIAQAYNIQLSFSEITVMMLTLMLASKGLPGSRVLRWWYWPPRSRASISPSPGFCC
jgi:Na+/H+-dicarboxylate symporter